MIRSSVVLPEPDGPSSASNSPLRDLEIDVVERREGAELLDDVLDFDGHLDSPSVPGGSPLRRRRHSRTVFTTSVIRASIASSEATANGADELIFVVENLDCSGMVLVSPRMWPDTTDTAPNSPIARALHSSTP